MAIPYAPSRMYEDRSSIGDLILRAGENKARGLREGGQIWGNAISNIGQLAAGTIRDIAEGKRVEAERKRREPLEAEQLESARTQNAGARMQYEEAIKKREASRRAEDVLSQGPVLGVTRQKILEQAKADPAIFEKVTAHIEREQAIENELFAEAAASVFDLSPENLVEGALTKLQDMTERGRLDKSEAESVAAQIRKGPDVARSTLLGLLRNSPRHASMAAAFEANEMKSAEAQRKAAEDAQRQADRAADNARADKALEAQLKHQERMAGIAASKQGEQKSLTPNAESALINKLSGQWTTATKPAVEIARQVKLMDAGLEAARRGDLAQGAQAVLVTFQKILDPPSVVRESEYNRSSAGLALMDRVSGAVERLLKGGAGVPLGELEKFANLAREAARAQSTGYLDSQKNRIGQVADRYGIPKTLVFEDFDFPGSMAAPTGASPKKIGRFTVEEER